MTLKQRVKAISERFEFHNGTQAERMATLEADLMTCLKEGLEQATKAMRDRLDEIEEELDEAY